MIVVDIPSAMGGGRIRTAALGSCRVHQPLHALAESGEITSVATGLHKSHTACHALYLLKIVAGEVTVPPVALPYLFNNGIMPRPRTLRDAAKDGADVFVLEVCSANQFFYGDTPLQEHLVADKLVKPYGRALLGWYRQICLSGVADEDCIQASLTNLHDGELQFENMEALLRGVRLRRQSIQDIARDLTEMGDRLGAACLLVGPISIEDRRGALMTERRALMDRIEAAGAECKVPTFDPSPLVSKFGREFALAGNGRDVYHYSRAFMPVIGKVLLEQIQEVAESVVGRAPLQEATATAAPLNH
jgi:hypothetical protein